MTGPAGLTLKGRDNIEHNVVIFGGDQTVKWSEFSLHGSESLQCQTRCLLAPFRSWKNRCGDLGLQLAELSWLDWGNSPLKLRPQLTLDSDVIIRTTE